MLEVEMKFSLPDVAGFRQQLEATGARFVESRSEQDRYFNAPDRDFAKTDEALRLRRVGEVNRLTYKGPKLDRQTKTRTEIELTIEPGERGAELATALVTSLGYRFVAIVTKERTVYRLKHARFDVEASIDEVEGVGNYAELEIQAPENQLEEARNAVLELAKQFKLSNSERRSYLEMWLEKHRGA